VLLPGAAGRLERRCARAMSWCMAHLERGDLRWHDIPKRIASEGGVAAVARAWKAERPGGERQATPRDPG